MTCRNHRRFRAAQVKLSNGETLRVHGPGTIEGRGHSVFQVRGNRQRLFLRDVDVRHRAPAPATGDRREVGAAVFALGKVSRDDVSHKDLVSEQPRSNWPIDGARQGVRLAAQRVAELRGGLLRLARAGACAVFPTPAQWFTAWFQ